MQVEITIPQSIIKIGLSIGWNEHQIKTVFLEYMKELMNHPYGHFEEDFCNWINGDDGDEFITKVVELHN